MERKDFIILIFAIVVVWIPMLVILNEAVIFYGVATALSGMAYWALRKELEEDKIPFEEPDVEVEKEEKIEEG